MASFLFITISFVKLEAAFATSLLTQSGGAHMNSEEKRNGM